MNRGDLYRLTLLIKDALIRIESIRVAITEASKTTIEAVAENTKTTNEAAKQQTPLPSRIAVDVNIPREEVNRYYTEHNKPNGLQWWAFGVNVITFLAVGGYAVVAILQWRALLESNRINREALVSVQRAYVTPRFPQLGDHILINPKTKQRSLEFSIIWENSGTTPTRNMLTYVNVSAREDPLPEDFAFHDIGHDRQIPFVLGPRATASATPRNVSVDVLEGIRHNTMHLYFWGWTKYRDIFQGTKEHTTRFCYELTQVKTEAKPIDRGSSLGVFYSFCNHNNCADEECEQQKNKH